MKQFSLIISIIALLCFQLKLLAQNNYIIPIVQLDSINAPSICMVSVTPDNKNIIVWEKAPNSFSNSFQIYRESTLQTGQYELIGESVYSRASIFIDSTAEPAKQSYRYKISAVDNCGNETALSPEHKTINLSILKGINGSWSLIWDQYVGFTVSRYMIYRGTKPDNMIQIGSVTDGNFSYNDFTFLPGDVYYQIEVIIPYLCNPAIKKSTLTYSSVWSNIASNKPLSILRYSNHDTRLKIFPNPGSDKISVSFPNPSKQSFELKLFDLTGKVKQSVTTYTDQVEISLENCRNGIFIVEIKGPEIFRDKVIVSKEY